MKMSDYVSLAIIAIMGTVIGYLLLNSLLGDPQDISFEYLVGEGSDLKEPDSEIFNFGAINPTVEVYVGSCLDKDGDGRLSDEEKEACGEGKKTVSNEETSTVAELENRRTNLENGYASGTPLQQREAVESEIQQYSDRQSSGHNDEIDYSDPARRETVSGE